MGGTEAIGILVGGGIVRYYLVSGGTAGIMDVLGSDIRAQYEKCEYTVSLNKYFADTIFEEEDSCQRFLIIDTNHVVFRRYGDKYEYDITKTD
jgi:hypothetical protein